MSVEISPEKPEYEIYIPSLTKDKIPISREKLDVAINFITGKAMDEHSGCNVITHVQGYWKGEDGEKVIEANKVIRVVGGNPLTDEDMEKIADYLEQECIAVKKTPNCEMQFHSVKPKETFRFYQKATSEGSGPEWWCEYYDEYGMVMDEERIDDSWPMWSAEGIPVIPTAEEINEIYDVPD